MSCVLQLHLKNEETGLHSAGAGVFGTVLGAHGGCAKGSRILSHSRARFWMPVIIQPAENDELKCSEE